MTVHLFVTTISQVIKFLLWVDVWSKLNTFQGNVVIILYFVNRHIVRSLNYAKKGGWGATPTPTSISILDSYDMKTL